MMGFLGDADNGIINLTLRDADDVTVTLQTDGLLVILISKESKSESSRVLTTPHSHTLHLFVSLLNV